MNLTNRRALTIAASACLLVSVGASALVDPDEPFDPLRIPLELQAWWTPNYGHIHAGTRLPLGQEISGTLEFDVRIVLHNNPSILTELRIDDDNGIIEQIVLDNLECPYDGITPSTCAFNVPVSLDTTEMQDGWRELRIRATTDTPDGLRYLNSSGIPLNVQNGGPDSDFDRWCGNTSLIGRGWYEGIGYANAVIECVPLQRVSGNHEFRVRAQHGSDHLNVALDKTHFIHAIDPWPEQVASQGEILFDADGNYQDFFPIEVDTRSLCNGWHTLAVRSTGPDGAESECDYCDGEINHPAGTAKVWFYVDNGPAGSCDGAEPCPADLNGNGSVDVPDLLLLLAAWDTNPGAPPDFDGDGVVAVPDLLTLLAAWGPCP